MGEQPTNRADELAAAIAALLDEKVSIRRMLMTLSGEENAGAEADAGAGDKGRARVTEIKAEVEALWADLKALDPDRHAQEWDKYYGWIDDLPEQGETVAVFATKK